jgi:hypothetical protein
VLTHHGRWTLVCKTDLHGIGWQVNSFISIIVLGNGTSYGHTGDKELNEGMHDGRLRHKAWLDDLERRQARIFMPWNGVQCPI